MNRESLLTPFAFLMNRYRGTSYQNKLLLSYFIFIMLPLLILSVYSYQQSSAVISAQAVTISEMNLKQAQSNLDAQQAQMMSLSQQMAQQSRVMAILEQEPAAISLSQEYDDLQELEGIIWRMVFTANIRDLRLYVNDGFRYSTRNLLTYSLEQLKNAAWFNQDGQFFTNSYFTRVYTFNYLQSEPAEIISAISLIRSLKDLNQVIGVVSVDLDKSELLRILSNVDYSSQGRAYIIDGSGQIICGYRSADQAALTVFAEGDEKYLASAGVRIHDRAVLTGMSAPGWGNWRILVVSPVQPLLENANQLRLRLIAATILVGIIIYFLAWFYARSNAGRILGLVSKMRSVQTGNFDVNCIVDSTDEIGELQSNFNLMIREIRLLLDEQYQLGQSLKDSELKVLQAQINPHFLYNTLDLILWTAKNNNTDEVCEIVIKLSKFYRLSLNNGDPFISIGDELEHVRLYVDLQNLRFQRKIDLVLTCAPENRRLKILNLLLQPIVENSILHGIQNLDDREGRIRVTVLLENQMLRIAVQDNGVGIYQNEMNRILVRKDEQQDNPGVGKFGLNNIMQRLRVYYGDEARLDVQSTPGEGTTVTIILPVMQKMIE